MVTKHTQTIQRNCIVVKNRQRSDYGDIDELAESIKTHGLIQPIVLDDDCNLIAGGRRLAAMDTLGWTEIPYVNVGELTEPQRKILEIEENIKRKDMTWFELCQARTQLHKLYSLNAAKEGNFKWSTMDTASAVNMSDAIIRRSIKLVKEAETDPKITQFPSMAEAMKYLVDNKLKEAKAVAASNVLESISTQTEKVVVSDDFEKDDVELCEEKVTKLSFDVPLSKIVVNDDCLNHMATLESESIPAIITDPPYGIDMSNLSQENTGMDVESVRAEHDVEENLKLLEAFLPAAYRVLKQNSFLVMWYDLSHHEKLVGFATKAGFAVQRWPLVWVKTSTCLNQMADVNFTKATEVAMVLRKGQPKLQSHQPVNYWIGPRDTKAHPFAKPIELWTWIIEATTYQGQLIYDPFAGSGSSTIAALNSQRRVLACEINKTHFNELVLQVSNHYKKLAESINQTVNFV